MDYWQNTVYGDTLHELREAADKSIKDFFGSLRPYVLDIRPHDSPGFRNIGDTAPKWEAEVRVDF